MAADQIIEPEAARLAQYTVAHYREPDTYEAGFWRRGMLRPNQLSAILYAHGYYGPESATFKPDSDWMRGPEWQLSLLDGLPLLRILRLVLSVGEGRGELALMLARLGARCIACDPSPGAIEIMAGCVHPLLEFWPLDVGAAMARCMAEGRIPDTVIFSESLEHIPEGTGDTAIMRCKDWRARLIVTNKIDLHPIRPDGTGWNHIRLVDDALYDRIAALGTLRFRQGSHLVVDF